MQFLAGKGQMFLHSASDMGPSLLFIYSLLLSLPIPSTSHSVPQFVLRSPGPFSLPKSVTWAVTSTSRFWSSCSHCCVHISRVPFPKCSMAQSTHEHRYLMCLLHFTVSSSTAHGKNCSLPSLFTFSYWFTLASCKPRKCG